MYPQPCDPLGPRPRLDLGHLRDRAGEVGAPPSATVTRICPPSIDTALAFLPMHPRGTDCCLPASLTSIVGGTTCSVTSPMLMCNRNWF